MENNTEVIQDSKDLSILFILWRNITAIIIATIIGLGAGIGLALLKGTTSYTVTKRVMFVAKYSDAGNTAGNDMVLAKLYLPNAVDKIESPLFIHEANEIYKTYNIYNTSQGATPISAGAVYSSFGDKSLIFSISYTDVSAEIAANKLKAVIVSAQNNLKKPEVTVAKDATIREVENRVTIKKNTNHAKFILLFTFLGFVTGVVSVLVKRTLDNTVKDKFELEDITGVPFLASIEDLQEVENKKNKKKKQKNKRKNKK